MDTFLDFLVEKIILPLLILLATGLVLFMVYGIYYLIHDHFHPPKEITLVASQWQCVHTYSYTSTTYIMSGKVMIPITNTYSACDVYSKAH